ncbi:hypothetical protein Bpfe_005957 [Biomphalaria pfeifferi]|uniref:ANKLE2 third alpha/beta domain-containing protein n=1 Tax=Biomphalaria pfeifferi TaxID=112525 RepID=A0AAD8C338_BIOPF|nr:hypothetical protein Bpfe_005957 [Biomphalaria pfeifferi]
MSVFARLSDRVVFGWMRVACSRYNGPNPATVKAKIINLIQEGVCYVPLIKSDTIGPCVKVGDPYSPTSPYKLVSEIEDVFRPATDAEASLKDIRNMKVWAFAGPMSPHEGREFKRAWKSPRTKRANLKESLKVTDGDRGFEHFGRELADNHATSWQEFWPFLNEFADLRSEAGLDKLETFFQKHSVIVNMQTFLRPLVQFVDAEPYRVGVEYILKPVPESSVSLESEKFVSVDSNVAESVSEQSQQTEEVSQVPQVSSVKDVVESENKSSPGFLSSLWGGLAKIKVYLSQSASKGSSQCSEVSQPKLLELDNVNPVQPLHDTGSPPLVSAEQGDSNDDKAKEDHDLSQEVPSSVLEKESKISLCETNIPVKQSMDEHVAQEESADDTPVRSSYSVENDSGIPEVFTVRSHMDNSLTPRHWKYRSSRYSLDSPEKERDSESPSRKSSSGRKYYSDSERDRESPSRRVSRLTKHYSDYHPDQRRPSPSKKESKSSSSFNAKMDSLCRHLDKFSIVSPEKSTSSLLSVSCDLTSLKSLILEPSLKIFMGKMFTQFTAYLNTVNKTTSNKAAPQDLPIACLKQDNETILADIFLPQAIPDSTWLTSVLDEQTHHEIVKNVWVNYLVLFPDSDNAQKVCSLSTDDVFNVVVEGLPEDNKLNSKSIKELYKQSCESIEDKLSLTLEMRVIRIDTIQKKDIFVCGSVPTKVDADIYNTLNAQSCQLIRGQSQRFSSCRQWLDRMDKPGREFICSLPSPARVLRLERRELFPVSPLVLNDTRLPPQMTSTPKSSRTPHIS